MGKEEFEVAIIGSGQAGVPLAEAFAEAGKKTALIESSEVGGCCINWGCTPTKTMIASAEVAYLAKRGPDYGVETSSIQIKLAKVRERKRNMVQSFREGTYEGISSTSNLELILGVASFLDPHTLHIAGKNGQDRELSAQTIFINTGCYPALPSIVGLDQVPYLDSTSIMELDVVPEHLVIVGGGYIGVEFGQMFQRFGSRVTILTHGKQLFSREDSDVALELAKILMEDGIEIQFLAKPISVKEKESKISLTYQQEGKEKTVVGSHLLIATGRSPATQKLNLPVTRVALDSHGNIQVNDHLETTVKGIYALGDVKGGPAFTHISYDDFRIIRTNFLNGGNATIKGRLVPYTVFTDPQLGRVGLTETEARIQGYEIQVAKISMSSIARAVEMDQSRGFIKAVVDKNTQQILGSAVLGIEGGEIMSMLEIAMLGKIPYPVLRDGIFAHPTLAEGLNILFTGGFSES